MLCCFEHIANDLVPIAIGTRIHNSQLTWEILVPLLNQLCNHSLIALLSLLTGADSSIGQYSPASSNHCRNRSLSVCCDWSTDGAVQSSSPGIKDRRFSWLHHLHSAVGVERKPQFMVHHVAIAVWRLLPLLYLVSSQQILRLTVIRTLCCPVPTPHQLVSSWLDSGQRDGNIAVTHPESAWHKAAASTFVGEADCCYKDVKSLAYFVSQTPW